MRGLPQPCPGWLDALTLDTMARRQVIGEADRLVTEGRVCPEVPSLHLEFRVPACRGALCPDTVWATCMHILGSELMPVGRDAPSNLCSHRRFCQETQTWRISSGCWGFVTNYSSCVVFISKICYLHFQRAEQNRRGSRRVNTFPVLQN